MEKRIVFMGDSITDCNRERPVSRRFSLGDGYVSLINAYLEMKHYKEGFRVMNCGVSGDTVKDLEARWETDVTANAPAYLSLMVGVNDVWGQFSLPFEKNGHISEEEYYGILRKLVEQTRARGTEVILMSPFLIETNEGDQLKALLRQYMEKMKTLARELETGYIDIQGAFDEYLKENGGYSMFLSSDRVHPGLTGHMIIARAWIKYFESHYLEGK